MVVLLLVEARVLFFVTLCFLLLFVLGLVFYCIVKYDAKTKRKLLILILNISIIQSQDCLRHKGGILFSNFTSKRECPNV